MITEQKLKNLIIRVEPELHKKIKSYVAEQGKTMQDYVLELIKKDIDNKSK